MNFELTEVQRDIQNMTREFAAKELIPNARKWDEEHEWPQPAVQKLAELSLLGVAVPPSSGAGPGWTTSATRWPWRRSAAAARRPASS